tara:strand:+ start:408628 stop:409077 length:450 start_codon:yes stop_codon:yes gene_type:complete
MKRVVCTPPNILHFNTEKYFPYKVLARQKNKAIPISSLIYMMPQDSNVSVIKVIDLYLCNKLELFMISNLFYTKRCFVCPVTNNKVYTYLVSTNFSLNIKITVPALHLNLVCHPSKEAGPLVKLNNLAHFFLPLFMKRTLYTECSFQSI